MTRPRIEMGRLERVRPPATCLPRKATAVCNRVRYRRPASADRQMPQGTETAAGDDGFWPKGPFSKKAKSVVFGLRLSLVVFRQCGRSLLPKYRQLGFRQVSCLRQSLGLLPCRDHRPGAGAKVAGHRRHFVTQRISATCTRLRSCSDRFNAASTRSGCCRTSGRASSARVACLACSCNAEAEMHPGSRFPAAPPFSATP